MQMVAQGWLVYALTGSPFYIGLVALARALPVFIFSLVGGTIADRADRRIVIAVANGVAGALALTLGILTWTNTVSIWHIVAIAFFSGLAFSFEMPCRQALVSDVVDEEDVVGAVGLNSLAFNTAAVVGPALAGLLIMQVDEGAIFMLNASAGLGAIVAVILVATLGTFRGRGMLVVGSAVVLGTALVIFALSASVTISLIVAEILGFSSNYGPISANTMLQTYSDNRMGGRVMDLHGLTMMGVMPLGAMLEGALGSLAGVPTVLCVGGILTAAVAGLIVMRAARLRELE